MDVLLPKKLGNNQLAIVSEAWLPARWPGQVSRNVLHSKKGAQLASEGRARKSRDRVGAEVKGGLRCPQAPLILGRGPSPELRFLPGGRRSAHRKQEVGCSHGPPPAVTRHFCPALLRSPRFPHPSSPFAESFEHKLEAFGLALPLVGWFC